MYITYIGTTFKILRKTSCIWFNLSTSSFLHSPASHSISSFSAKKIKIILNTQAHTFFLFKKQYLKNCHFDNYFNSKIKSLPGLNNSTSLSIIHFP